MKDQTIAELKSWRIFCLIGYAVGWASYALLIFLDYLSIAWIAESYIIFIVIWVIGNLFLIEGIYIHYMILCKEEEKSDPH